MSEDCEVKVKDKLPMIKPEIIIIDSEHYLVSFRYREYYIAHTLEEVLGSIEREIKEKK